MVIEYVIYYKFYFHLKLNIFLDINSQKKFVFLLD